jgi:hypothetical protein
MLFCLEAIKRIYTSGELKSAASASSHDHGCHSGPSALFQFIDQFVSGKAHRLGSDIPRKFLCTTNKLAHSHPPRTVN